MGDTRHSGATADFSRFEPNNKEPSTDSGCQSTATLPTNTKTDEGAGPQGNDTTSSTRQSQAANPNDGPEDIPSATESAVPPNHSSDKLPTSSETNSQVTTGSNGWLSWLSRPVVSKQSEHPKNDGAENQQNTDNINESPQPQILQTPQTSEPPEQPELPTSPQPSKSTKQASSWFSIWPYSANPTTKDDLEHASVSKDNTTESKGKESTDVIIQDAPTVSVPAPAPTPVTTQPSAGSTWAFWSRDTAPPKTGGHAPPPKQGELAVMGDGSETSPKKSTVKISEEPSTIKEPPIKSVQKQSTKTASTKKAKKGETRPIDADGPPLSRPGTPSSEASAKIPVSKSISASTSTVTPPNLLLPSFKSTYRMKQNPSIIKQITHLLLRTQQQPSNHVFLSRETPKIKKAMAIGVHGLFPASYLRPMIGQPTGTSIKFANHCADAIRRWTDSNGSGGCEINTVALEGEGKIGDRVENLWKLLLNWIEDIKDADLIMVACHSQGVPVGIMLLEKLIELGVITNSPRLGVCAMAGVSLGPFPDYKSGMGILMGTAAELWQFADPASEVSKRYEHALKTVVEYGAHITVSGPVTGFTPFSFLTLWANETNTSQYVGSIDDQLVPLQSALYGPASHPNIYRAVFIDGRIHAPDFIAHLVGFALKLRNLGISDHGLIRELSVPLAGSLYSGEGHSRLYDDGQVYEYGNPLEISVRSFRRRANL